MKYLQKSFTVGPPSKVFGCEACIYGKGEHSCDPATRKQASEKTDDGIALYFATDGAIGKMLERLSRR